MSIVRFVQQAKSALAASQATLDDNQAAKRIQTAKIQNAEAMVTQADAAVSAARASVASMQPEVERTALQHKRQEALMAALKLLAQAEAEGIELRSCPVYIREWTSSERESS